MIKPTKRSNVSEVVRINGILRRPICYRTTWPDEYLDLIEPAHITFEDRSDGELVFGAAKGWLDVLYGSRDGRACAEFSWEGNNDADDACGRGGSCSEPGRPIPRDRNAPKPFSTTLRQSSVSTGSFLCGCNQRLIESA